MRCNEAIGVVIVNLFLRVVRFLRFYVFLRGIMMSSTSEGAEKNNLLCDLESNRLI